jgi:hypothetical protein
MVEISEKIKAAVGINEVVLDETETDAEVDVDVDIEA